MNWLAQGIRNWKNRHYDTCWNWLSEGSLVGREWVRAKSAYARLTPAHIQKLVMKIQDTMESSDNPEGLRKLWNKVVIFRLDTKFPDSFADDCLESSIFRSYKRYRMEPYPTAVNVFCGDIPARLFPWLFETSPSYWLQMWQDGELDHNQAGRLVWRAAQDGNLSTLQQYFDEEPVPDYLLRTCAKAAWKNRSADYIECILALGYKHGLPMFCLVRRYSPQKRKVKKRKKSG